MHEQAKLAAPHAEAIVASPRAGAARRGSSPTNFEHIPPELLAHQMLGVASATGAPAMIEYALRDGYGASTRSGSPARCGSCGARTTGSCRGRLPPRAFATTGCRTPTGSSSTASATALSSTPRSRPRSSSSGMYHGLARLLHMGAGRPAIARPRRLRPPA